MSLEKGLSVTPEVMSHSSIYSYTEMFTLWLVFDKIVYPPPKEWKNPDEYAWLELEEFVELAARWVNAGPYEEPWWSKCVVI